VSGHSQGKTLTLILYRGPSLVILAFGRRIATTLMFTNYLVSDTPPPSRHQLVVLQLDLSQFTDVKVFEEKTEFRILHWFYEIYYQDSQNGCRIFNIWASVDNFMPGFSLTLNYRLCPFGDIKISYKCSYYLAGLKQIFTIYLGSYREYCQLNRNSFSLSHDPQNGKYF